MVAMAYEAAWPAAGQPFTVDDLDRLPDDGRRYEVLDGVLIVSPRPTTMHQLAASQLAASLLTTKLTNALTVFELRDGAYQRVAQSSGGAAVRVERPFPVEIVPAQLTLS